jgi:archaellum component FlaC
MKRIIKSRLEEHMVDLYSRVDNLKKDISVIKNNHLKHMSCAIYKIEKKVDKILWAMITGMGALILTLLAIAFKLIK